MNRLKEYLSELKILVLVQGAFSYGVRGVAIASILYTTGNNSAVNQAKL